MADCPAVSVVSVTVRLSRAEGEFATLNVCSGCKHSALRAAACRLHCAAMDAKTFPTDELPADDDIYAMAGLIRALGREPELREVATDDECVRVEVPQAEGQMIFAPEFGIGTMTLIVYWSQGGWCWRKPMRSDSLDSIGELYTLLGLEPAA